MDSDEDEDIVVGPEYRLLESDRIRKRRRITEELIDGYEYLDEEALVTYINKDENGPIQAVIDCFLDNALEIGEDGAAVIATKLFNETCYKRDQNLARNTHRPPVLAKKMTKTAMLKFAERLKALPRGRELALSNRISYIQESIEEFQNNSLWCIDGGMDEKNFKIYKSLIDLEVKLTEIREKCSSKRNPDKNLPPRKSNLPNFRGAR